MYVCQNRISVGISFVFVFLAPNTTKHGSRNWGNPLRSISFRDYVGTILFSYSCVVSSFFWFLKNYQIPCINNIQIWEYIENKGPYYYWVIGQMLVNCNTSQTPCFSSWTMYIFLWLLRTSNLIQYYFCWCILYIHF